MKRKKRGGFAKTAPKTLEKKIIDNAKKIKEDLDIILPKPLDEKSQKVVLKLRKKLEKVWYKKEDLKSLEKFAKKRGIGSALAGILMLANNPKAPYLAHVRFIDRDIAYAVRGKADKEKVISFQYFDDPILRLIGYKDISSKKKIAFYSWGENFVCKYAGGDIPAEFIAFLAEHLNLEIKTSEIFCPHINKEKEYLHMRLKNLDIKICRYCLKDTNTFMEISKYFIDPYVKKDINVEIVSDLSTKYKLKTHFIEEYLEGSLGDLKFFYKNIDLWKEKLKSEDKKLVYIKGKIFEDTKELINSLDATPTEKKILETILSKIEGPIFLEDQNVNGVLSKYWKTYGKRALIEIFGNEKLVDIVFNLEEPPVKQIEKLESLSGKIDMISKYPDYQNLPPVAEFTDRLAKEYLLYGKERVISLISKPPHGMKKRAISYAFLLFVGKGEEKRWQYSQEEIEFGEFLKSYVEDLVKSKPDEYHLKLKNLLRAAGVDEKI